MAGLKLDARAAAHRGRPGQAPVLVRKRSAAARRDARVGWLLISPAAVLVFAFVLVPLGFAVYISLTNWPLVGPYHFIGLENYTNLASNTVFIHALVYTVMYTAIVTPPILVLGYLLALLVRSRRRGAVVFRTLFFIPFVVGITTESYMLVLELQPNSGAVDYILSTLRLASASTPWLVNTALITLAASLLVVWFASGLDMVILMAGMQGIPLEVYEAASVDGASWWDKEVRVTLPLLRRPIALCLIITVIGSFLTFNQFYVLSQGGPGTSTDTVVMWLYQTAFVQLHLGAATAMAFVVILVVGILSLGQFMILRRDATR